MAVHYNKNRKVRISAFYALFCLILGGLIAFLVLNHHIQNDKPELKVQVEMKNYAQT